jgi:uncharacterized protein YdaU (DUF1376 family)
VGNGRHSYVKFYPSDWLAGTARLSRLLRGIYFDVCVHNWDHAEPLSKAEQALVFSDVGNWPAHVQALIDMGKLKRTKGGGLYSERALNEARSSIERWSNAVASGREGAAKRWGIKGKTGGSPNGVAIANQNQNQTLKEEKEKEPIGSKKKASAWHGGEEVPEMWLAWAKKDRGWSGQQAKEEAGRFIDNAMAHRRLYVDWFAAWRNWCRSPFQKTVAQDRLPLTL